MKINEKGGVDAYIATTICLLILLLFTAMGLSVMKVMNDYTTLQRAMDLSVDGIKTHGGYTLETHQYIRSLIDNRHIDPKKVSISVTHNGVPITNPQAITYGDGNIKVTVTYQYTMKFMKKTYAWPITTSSNAMSQFVFGATPHAEEQRYVIMAGERGNISLNETNPPALQDPVLVEAAHRTPNTTPGSGEGYPSDPSPNGGSEQNPTTNHPPSYPPVDTPVDNDTPWK